MSNDTKRVSAEVDADTKLRFELIAQREGKSEAQLLRELVADRIKEEDIPQEVIEYFREDKRDAREVAAIN
jgi:hypothetical protein